MVQFQCLWLKWSKMVVPMATTHPTTHPTTHSFLLLGEWILPFSDSSMTRSLLDDDHHIHTPAMFTRWKKVIILHMWIILFYHWSIWVRKSKLVWPYWSLLSSSCGMDESPFRNCSGYTKCELQGVVATSYYFAATCCLYLPLLSMIIVVIKKGKVYESVMKRLTVWLTAVTFLCQLLLALNLTPLIDYNFFYRKPKLCQVYGFVIQYSWSVQLVFMFGVSLLLFFKVLEASPWKPAYVTALQERVKGRTFTCHGWEFSKEISFLIAGFVIPFLFDLIPFMTNSYGHFGPFCWIHDIETDCSTHMPGQVQQIILLIVPFGILALLTLGLLVMSLYLLHCAIKNARVQKNEADPNGGDYWLHVIHSLPWVHICALWFSGNRPFYAPWVLQIFPVDHSSYTRWLFHHSFFATTHPVCFIF